MTKNLIVDGKSDIKIAIIILLEVELLPPELLKFWAQTLQ